MINPDSDWVLNAGDILWIVGDKTSLDQLKRKFLTGLPKLG